MDKDIHFEWGAGCSLRGLGGKVVCNHHFIEFLACFGIFAYLVFQVGDEDLCCILHLLLHALDSHPQGGVVHGDNSILSTNTQSYDVFNLCVGHVSFVFNFIHVDLDLFTILPFTDHLRANKSLEGVKEGDHCGEVAASAELD